MQNQFTQPSQYAGMSPEGLLQECERLQLLTTSQARHIKNIEQAAINVIADFSGVILAHIRNDADAVRSRLAAIVNKNVMMQPAEGSVH